MTDNDAPSWAVRLQASVDETNATLSAIREKFDSVADEIAPAIDKISAHPMVKMFLGRKDKP